VNAFSHDDYLVEDGLAMLRQAERPRQPKPGSDFQMRRRMRLAIE
jgi:hypothetical protein